MGLLRFERMRAIARITALAAEGLPSTEIMRRTGYCRHTVLKYAPQTKMRERRHTPETKASAVAMRQSGMQVVEVAVELCVAPSTVRRWTAELGLSVPRAKHSRGLSASQKESIRRLRRLGVSRAEVARRLGHCEKTVRRWDVAMSDTPATLVP